MAGGFRSVSGAVVVLGLMGCPLWAWACRYLSPLLDVMISGSRHNLLFYWSPALEQCAVTSPETLHDDTAALFPNAVWWSSHLPLEST